MMRIAPALLGFAGLLAATATFALAGTAGPIEESAVTTHRSQGEVRTIEGATARLSRTAEGIFVGLETAGLTPGHAYTLLLAVMNDPGACESAPCAPSDVVGRTAEVKADIVGDADGIIVGEDGTARFASFLPAGELPKAWFGNGLTNPEGAEVHLVVNDHGPYLPEHGAEMLTTYRGGCADEGIPGAFPDTAKADGAPGPNTCRMVQVAIFAPANM